MSLPVARPRRAVDDTLVAALAAGRTYDDAASAAGCSARTVDRRMTDPGFRRRVQELRAATFTRTAALLVDGAAEAVAQLRDLMRTADSDAARVSAARAVLTLAPTWRDAVEIESRVAELAERVDKLTADPTTSTPRSPTDDRRPPPEA